MGATGWHRRFMESTRGRIIALLRGRSRTVGEMAGALDLTDNAVRAHLTALERDGLVEQRGRQRGTRKPHLAYHLTDDAETLFPKAYGPLLSGMLAVLEERMPAEELESLLREVGRRAAAAFTAGLADRDLAARVDHAKRAIGELGGVAEIVREEDRILLQGSSCPFGSVVGDHPMVCQLAEEFVAQITGAPVRECCSRNGAPSCCFEITPGREREGAGL